MASAKFSMRLEPELKNWLEAEAKRKDRSAGFIATQAIQNLMQQTEARNQIIREAMAEADKGVFVSAEAVNDWFAELDTANERAFPKADVFIKSAS